MLPRLLIKKRKQNFAGGLHCWGEGFIYYSPDLFETPKRKAGSGYLEEGQQLQVQHFEENQWVSLTQVCFMGSVLIIPVPVETLVLSLSGSRAEHTV